MNPDQMTEFALDQPKSVGSTDSPDDMSAGIVNAEDLRVGDVNVVPNSSGFEVEGEVAVEAAEEATGVEEPEASEEAQSPDEAEEASEENPVKPQNRAQKRIQELAKARDEARAELQAYQQSQNQQFEALKYQMQMQYQAQVAQMQQQMEFQRQQLELTRTSQQKEEDKNLTEAERIERQWRDRATQDALKQLSPELAALKQQLAQVQQREQAQRQQFEQQARFNHFTSQAADVTQKQLLKGFDPKDSGELSGQASDMFLTYWTAFGVDSSGRNRNPAEVAKEFKGFLDKYAAAANRAVSKVGATKVKPAMQAPKVAAVGQKAPGTVGKGEAWPSEREVQKAGFRNIINWISAGKPALNKGKK